MAKILLYLTALVLLICTLVNANDRLNRRHHHHHHRALDERAAAVTTPKTTTHTTTAISKVTVTTSKKTTTSSTSTKKLIATSTSTNKPSTTSTSMTKSTTTSTSTNSYSTSTLTKTSSTNTSADPSSTSTSSTSSSTSASSTSSSTSASSTSSSTSTSSTSSSTGTSTRTSASTAASATATYWMETIRHQGYAPFSSSPSTYVVYRNVKDYGAKGDGVTDDTAAINSAISAGSRCGQGCDSSTTTPALIYFPGGTYLVSSPIQALYFSQLIGNPNDLPIIKGTAGFTGYALFDGNPVDSSGNAFYTSTNNFYRVIKNFVIDTTNISASSYGTGVHWRVAQATSLQNLVFKLSTASGNNHQGIYMEDGSGGFMSDLVFYGGKFGAYFGNQQFTSRNLTFYGSDTAIFINFDWSWTFVGLSINNCNVGIDITEAAAGSVTVIDSSFTDTEIGVLTVKTSSTTPVAAGSFVMENIQLDNVPIAVALSPAGTALLAGTTGTSTIKAWGQGQEYTPRGKDKTFQSAITLSPARLSSLLDASGNYVTHGKPNYETLTGSNFISARSQGAKGDGVTDDTAALQKAFTASATAGKVLYLDFGVYIVTSTLYVPPGVKIFGEAWPAITGYGKNFQLQSAPQPILQIGKAGDTGIVEIQNLVVQTKGPSAGAILIEYNLASPAGMPSGLWDVHTRVGGSTGTSLQSTQCAKNPTSTKIITGCEAAFMLMHITKSGSGLVMENNWLWTADHELDLSDHGQITIYSGRGLLVESTTGLIWLYGTAVEHNVLYQYQFSNTQAVFMGLVQTETPYYQGNPNALTPFTVNTTYNDPNYSSTCAGVALCEKALGIRMVSSTDLFAYGTGLYSFFDNYAQTCLNASPQSCQTNMISIETCTNIRMYNVNTVGATNMISINNVAVASETGYENAFTETIAYFSLD